MNRASLLHIIERLEGFLGRLPASIQKPVLHELTPLKELFLQQRPPRFVLTGSNRFSVQEIVSALFAEAATGNPNDVLMELFRWQTIDLNARGTVHLLDARGADDNKIREITQELKQDPADIFLYLADESRPAKSFTSELDNLTTLQTANTEARQPAGIIGVIVYEATATPAEDANGETLAHSKTTGHARLQKAFEEKPSAREHLLQIFDVGLTSPNSTEPDPGAKAFMSLLARHLPNEARVEMVRIARDTQAQIEIAQSLVKSTTAICAAIGAQPIPLADLPVLTTLQLVMVSGIMYISGRERSLRAATEFLSALGVNVGAALILREGTRAILKFFPGWGNVVCGMVAGAGTYGIGRAAISYFLEGLSLKEARRTYLANRKRKPGTKQQHLRNRPVAVTPNGRGN